MKKRIKYMYEQGDTEYIDILLQAKSISDMLNRSEYFNAIYEYDRNMLIRYQETKEAVDQYRTQLEEERAEQEVMQLEYESQQANLETTIATVSYTHLDVYKRQPLLQRLHGAVGEGSPDNSPWLSCVQSLSLIHI